MPNEGDINFQNNTVTINEIPTILKVSLDNITPQTATMTKKVFLDDEPKLSLDDNNFELSLTENKTYQVRIVIEDSNRDMKSEETFSVEIKRDDIVGKLLVKPDTVGTDPFTVTFDASTTVVNDPDDEIVYFTWDFGDGETKNDISQSVISHTYTYDYEKEAGNYYPTVTLSTKKGREITVSTDSPIIVKKEVKTFEINVDSHPSQQAKIGDTVQFSLDLDSLPTKIYWDFGDGNTLECKERECVETNKIYLEAGTYKIKVQIVDDKAPMSESSITLKVVD